MSNEMRSLKAEEQRITSQLKAYETCTSVIMDTIRNNELNKLAVEDMLVSVHRLQQELQTELLHNRLAQAFITNDTIFKREMSRKQTPTYSK